MDRVERYTYHWHLRASVAEGAYMGLVWSSPDVAARNLGAGPLEITLLTMAPGVAQLASLFVAGRMGTVSRRKLLLGGALLGRLPVLLVFFYHDLWSFLLLLTVQSFAQVPIVTAWNSLLRTNYRDHLRGRLFGRGARVTAIFSGLATLGAGVWLDHDPQAVRWIYPVAALLGVISCWTYARVRARPGGLEEALENTPPAARGTWSTVRDVLGHDQAFRQYEIAFFCYGVAFMAAITALPLFAADSLQLSNTEMLGGRTLFSLLTIVGSSWMGGLMDRLGPARLAGFCYGFLAIIMVLLATAVTSVVSYLALQALFGLAMSGVMIVWNMGPIAFARPRDASRYMGIHMALVGFRAMIGHPVGGLLLSQTGEPRYVFLFSVVLFGAGSYGMLTLARQLRLAREQLQADDRRGEST